MNLKIFDAIDVALSDLSATAKKLIISSENTVWSKMNVEIIVLKGKFNIEHALALIADVKHIGIVNPEKFAEDSLTKLICTLTNENKATVVSISSSPVSCKVFYPHPNIGTNYFDDNYQYRYGQRYYCNQWQGIGNQNGWGVKTRDVSMVDYPCPLSTIMGIPVTDMSCLFYQNPNKTLNLIDWDTSNVTNMEGMFYGSSAVFINGLSNFDTTMVTSMNNMFAQSMVGNLDLSSFTSTKANKAKFMFFESKVLQITARTIYDGKRYRQTSYFPKDVIVKPCKITQ